MLSTRSAQALAIALVDQTCATEIVALLNATGGGPFPQSAITGLVADLAAKAPLASPVLTGRPSYPAHISPWQPLPSPVTGTITIDWSVADRWYGTLPNTAVTLAYTGVPSAGSSQVLNLRLTQPASGAACSITWPTGSVYPAGTAPAISTSTGKIDTVVVSLDPSGSAYETTLVGADYH